MSSVSHKGELFNDSGCLSQYALEAYKDHLLSEEELLKVQLHLSDCLLCSDAVDGLSAEDVDLGIDLSTRTNNINMQLRRKFNYDPYHRRNTRMGPRLNNLLIPVAASLIILVGIIAYFHFLFPDRQEMAMLDKKEATIIAEEKEGLMEAPSQAEPFAKETEVVGGVAVQENKTPEIENLNPQPVAVDDIKKDEDLSVMVFEGEKAGNPVLAKKEEEVITSEIAKPEEVVTMNTVEETAMEGVVKKDKAMGVSRAKSIQEEASPEEIFSMVEHMPEFPGGEDSLYQFIARNIRYPQDIENPVSTKVVVRFLVSKKGAIKNVEIIRSGGPAFDDEVLKLMKLMPAWIPGQQKGKPVAVLYVLPIHFEN